MALLLCEKQQTDWGWLPWSSGL